MIKNATQNSLIQHWRIALLASASVLLSACVAATPPASSSSVAVSSSSEIVVASSSEVVIASSSEVVVISSSQIIASSSLAESSSAPVASSSAPVATSSSAPVASSSAVVVPSSSSVTSSDILSSSSAVEVTSSSQPALASSSSATSNGIANSLECLFSNSQNNGNFYFQVSSFTVTNTGSISISPWMVVINLDVIPTNLNVFQGGIIAEIAGNNLSFSGAELGAGESISFGFGFNTGIATPIGEPVCESSGSNSSSTAVSSSEVSSNSALSSSSVSNPDPGNVPVDALIFDNFESGIDGQAPEGWSVILGFGPLGNPASNNVGAPNYALIDSSVAYSGEKSVHIRMPGNSTIAGQLIYRELPANVDRLYVRTWMNTSADIGKSTPGGHGDHAHFMGTFASPEIGSVPREVRFGIVRGGPLGGFHPSDGDTSTEQNPATTIQSGVWTCVEWAVYRDTAFDEMYGWVNDELVLAAVGSSDWGQIGSSNWADGTQNYVQFGWRQFGSVASMTDIWFDDIVVSESRVGCN